MVATSHLEPVQVTVGLDTPRGSAPTRTPVCDGGGLLPSTTCRAVDRRGMGDDTVKRARHSEGEKESGPQARVEHQNSKVREMDTA